MSAAPTVKGDHTDMKHFTIDAENNITAHATRKEAKETGAGTSRAKFDSRMGGDGQIMFSSLLTS